ncbi:Mss4-like protein [Coniochaeta sp. 2T2.1]|nr:Mss4-like protein [Coniochaeta sp. 2T2.1]
MASSQDELPAGSPPNPEKLTASCHCGRVKLELPAPPTKVNECRCSICYRYGALWAYYPRDEVLVTSEEPGMRSYVREDQGAKGTIAFYACNTCNSLTHWWAQPEHVKPTPDWNRMGVNTRMLPESLLEGVERKIGRK